MIRKAVTASLVVAVSAAGCCEPPAPPVPNADRALTRAGLLRLTDLPAGWTEPDDQVPETAANCASDEPRTSKLSPMFVGEANASIYDGVNVYASRRDAIGAMRDFSSRALRECMAEVLQSVFVEADDTATVDVDAAALRVPSAGQAARGNRYTVRLDHEDGAQTVVIEDEAVRVGRVVIVVSLQRPETARLDRVRTSVVDEILRRLKPDADRARP